jgi:membrane protein YdbS with pleckstrin-like domain
MATKKDLYPASLDIDYPKKLDRLTTFFRAIWAIPVLIILVLLTAAGNEGFNNEAGKEMSKNGGGIVAGLFAATALMILFQQRYPRWWFDFNLELNRFSMRVSAYLLLLTDLYPSTVEKQSVQLEIEYPDVKRDLNRWMPLVKWLLAVPHYVVLFVLTIAAVAATVIAWFAILFTGRYPQDLFNFVVGVNRWGLRVNAYAFLLVTDQYPPFSLK